MQGALMGIVSLDLVKSRDRANSILEQGLEHGLVDPISLIRTRLIVLLGSCFPAKQPIDKRSSVSSE